MPSDYDIIFTKSTQVSELPKSGLKQAALKLIGRKVTTKTKESHNLEMTVTEKIGTEILKIDIHGLERSQLPPLNKHLFIPIALRNIKNEIIYVNINELANQLQLSNKEVQKLVTKTANARSEEMAGKIAYNQLDALLYKKAKEKKAFEVLLPTLMEKLSAPIEEEVAREIDKWVLDSPKLDDNTLKMIGKSEAFQSKRTGGSNTLQSSDSSLKSQSQINWLEADAFVRELAINQQPLTLNTICNINKILRQNIEGEEELLPGQLRDAPISSGGG